MSSRPAPPGAPPPSYAVISRVYRHSLRPVVLATATLSCIYAAIWGASAFDDIGDDKTISSQISTMDIVMGAIYMGVLLIEGFGVFSAWKQRAPLVRIYSFLGIIGILAVMTAEMIRIVVHFKFKHTIINNCIQVVTTASEICDGPFCRHEPLNLSDGTDYCNSRWSRNTFGDIAWFLAASIFAFLFNSFSWGYLHQLLSAGTRLDVGPGVGGAEGRGDHIGLHTYAPRYDPPAYPPPAGGVPRDSTDEDVHFHGMGGDVPKYDGYNAGDYLPGGDKGEKAPGYEFATATSGKPRDFDDEDDLGAHGPPVQNTNPFR